MNPRPENIFAGLGNQLSLQVEAIVFEAEGVVSLALSNVDGTPLPAWQPGAHIDLILSAGMTRQYSLCGDSLDPRKWRIGVLLAVDGRGGSKHVHEKLQIGDVVEVSAPRNNFHLVEAEHYLFIAGGIGITPILPMIREVSARGGRWTLLYGGRSHASMAFVSEIASCSGGDIHLMPQDTHGLLDLKRFLTEPKAGEVVYCCGPEPLIDAVELRCFGWPNGALHRERFAPRQRFQPIVEDGFDVQLARTSAQFSVPPGKNLLKALEEAGCEISNSCRAGICGTCAIPVLEGELDHRDDLLSVAQREAGKVILPCVSRCKSKLLILDI